MTDELDERTKGMLELMKIQREDPENFAAKALEFDREQLRKMQANMAELYKVGREIPIEDQLEAMELLARVLVHSPEPLSEQDPLNELHGLIGKEAVEHHLQELVVRALMLRSRWETSPTAFGADAETRTVIYDYVGTLKALATVWKGYPIPVMVARLEVSLQDHSELIASMGWERGPNGNWVLDPQGLARWIWALPDRAPLQPRQKRTEDLVMDSYLERDPERELHLKQDPDTGEIFGYDYHGRKVCDAHGNPIEETPPPRRSSTARLMYASLNHLDRSDNFALTFLGGWLLFIIGAVFTLAVQFVTAGAGWDDEASKQFALTSAIWYTVGCVVGIIYQRFRR